MPAFNAGGWGGIGRFRMQRQDQGQDFEIAHDAWITAPGDAEVVAHASDGPFPNGFGSPYAIVRVDSGRFAVGNGEWYVGHCNRDLASVGTKLKLGDPIARANNSLNPGWGWCELGKWDEGPHPDGEGAKWAHLFTPLEVAPAFTPLKRGSRGKRVVALTRRLAYIHAPGSGKGFLKRWYWRYGKAVKEAVRAYQHLHGLKMTGVVDQETGEEIQRSFKRQRANRRRKHR